MTVKFISRDQINHLVGDLIKDGKDVFSPVSDDKNRYYISKIANPKDIILNYTKTHQSVKSIFFPKNEILFSYRKSGEKFDILKPKVSEKLKVLIGIHPCDAAAIGYMDQFFMTGLSDELYSARRNNTIIISMACSEPDEFCFCSSVGLSPDSKTGSDIILTQANGGGFIAETNTDLGQSFIEEYLPYFEEASGRSKIEPTIIPEVFNLDKLVEKAKSAFDSQIWLNDSLSCLGCGTCAYVCPTCSCFDVQDESNPSEGRRIRIWDSCGFGLFTQHASGHNPRNVQSQRWRNRILHKFNYSIENLDKVSCVGCGRCLVSCPAGMSILDTVEKILEQ